MSALPVRRAFFCRCSTHGAGITAMIIRSQPSTNWTALPNAIFRDPSLDTKGALEYLLGLPPGWEVRPGQVAKALRTEGGRPIGKERLQRMFREMQAAGYMWRSGGQSHDEETGYFGAYDYVVGADPEAVRRAKSVANSPQPNFPPADQPRLSQPQAANPLTDKTKIDINNPPAPLPREFAEVGPSTTQPAARLERELSKVRDTPVEKAPEEVPFDRALARWQEGRRAFPNSCLDDPRQAFRVWRKLAPSLGDLVCGQKRS
jgi:hypothetical protein